MNQKKWISLLYSESPWKHFLQISTNMLTIDLYKWMKYLKIFQITKLFLLLIYYIHEWNKMSKLNIFEIQQNYVCMHGRTISRVLSVKVHWSLPFVILHLTLMITSYILIGKWANVFIAPPHPPGPNPNNTTLSQLMFHNTKVASKVVF